MTVRADPEQERVLASPARHLVVVAPPGTGKTSLAARLAAERARGIGEHQRVLLLTFSNQARSELEREVASHVPTALRRRVEVTNYHRFFWGLTLRYRRVLELPELLTIVSSRRREAVIRGATRHHALLGALDECAELLVPAMRPAPTALNEAELARVLAAVRREHAEGRLVFGDFGAFWALLVTRQPTLRRALRERYPVVIADEHQDASQMQEALVRELGTSHVIFADPMQLIHAFRGADWGRLEGHMRDADEIVEIATPHRWHDSPALGSWLLETRDRLRGDHRRGARPPEVVITLTAPAHGTNGMLGALPAAIRRARQDGARSIAVMAWQNGLVADVRRYLCRHGMRPAQLGIWHAFDRLVELPEQLEGKEPKAVAAMIVDTLAALAPQITADDVSRARARLKVSGVRGAGASVTVASMLAGADAGYRLGPGGYFAGVAVGVDALARQGIHAPALEEVSLYRRAAAGSDLSAQIDLFRSALMATTHRATRADRGVLTMTVHQAKGREFDAVVLVGADATSYRWESDESVRLFYVAITRARKHWEIIAIRGRESRLIDALGTT